ncbi:MAG: hypothetical protein SGARI_002371 [Bacillariaceae sp.]
MSATVEALYQQSQSFAGVATPTLAMTASSGFQYALDFVRMVQRNTTSGKERPIASSMFSFGRLGGSSRSTASSASRTSTRYSCTLKYTAPVSLHEVKVDEAKVFQNVSDPPAGKPKAQSGGEEKKNGDYHDADDDCAICMDALWDQSGGFGAHRVVSIKACQHCFHYNCIHEALSKGCGGKCPICSTPIDGEAAAEGLTSKGKCPSGTLTVQNDPSTSCAGYENCDALILSYSIRSGTQMKYHPAPNLRFSGASRVGYLPNNAEGQDLLVRMQYAFMHGLSFMVGTSLTTGQTNVVTWASIHHKTSPSGGTYGYPDPGYFTRSNSELDALGVPDPAGCRSWLLRKCPGYV